jgi:hypothetical protein
MMIPYDLGSAPRATFSELQQFGQPVPTVAISMSCHDEDLLDGSCSIGEFDDPRLNAVDDEEESLTQQLAELVSRPALLLLVL